MYTMNSRHYLVEPRGPPKPAARRNVTCKLQNLALSRLYIKAQLISKAFSQSSMLDILVIEGIALDVLTRGGFKEQVLKSHCLFTGTGRLNMQDTQETKTTCAEQGFRNDD